MRKIVLIFVLLAVWASPVSAYQVPGTCTLNTDTTGNLVVTGSGLEGNYYYGWGLYADGVPVPAGYTPWLDYGYFTTANDGTWSFTMGTSAYFESEYPGLGPYPLGFYVFQLHGSKNLVGTNNLTTHQNYLASCSTGQLSSVLTPSFH